MTTFFMSGMTLLIVANDKNDTNGTALVELSNDKDEDVCDKDNNVDYNDNDEYIDVGPMVG